MHRPVGRHLVAIVIVAVTAALVAPAATASASGLPTGGLFPQVINLPNGWRPEGIAKGPFTIMYSGSLATGNIRAVEVATGKQWTAVTAPAGRVAVGIEQDRLGRFWAAGGALGQAYVYGPFGRALDDFQLVAPPTSSFINDVVVTSRAAWFTDSRSASLWRIPIGRFGRIGEPMPLQLSGITVDPAGTNLNGIDVSADGRWLLAVQTNTGTLFRIDPESGEATAFDLGGTVLTGGDGVLVDGNTVYVVQNRLNQIAVLDVDVDASVGTLVKTIVSPTFDVPTTVAQLGSRLYLVNARFTTPPTPETPYTMVAVPR